MAQQLRLCTLSAGDVGWIPGQGTRSHIPQLKVHMLQLEPAQPKKKKDTSTPMFIVAQFTVAKTCK